MDGRMTTLSDISDKDDSIFPALYFPFIASILTPFHFEL